VIVLCSDGLTTMVSEAKIEKILNNAKDLDAAVKRLVKEANSEGGRDNITVLAFRLAAAGEPAAASAEPAPADPATEDATLIGPTATDAGLDAEAMRAASPRRERTPALNKPRRSTGRRVARVVIALGIIALVVGGAIYGARQVYFLGTDDGGRVALYRGLPYELPFGVNLYSEQYSAPVQVDSLTVARQRSVTAHELRSHDDAVSLIDDIQRTAPAPNGTPNRRGGGNATNPGAKGGGGKGKSGGGKKSTGGGGKGKSGGAKKSTGGGKSKSSSGNGGGGSKGG
jgi:PPM family protein phosphatase